MALIQCPDCGKEISDLAEVCIGCGRLMLSKGQKQSDIESSKSTATTLITEK